MSFHKKLSEKLVSKDKLNERNEKIIKRIDIIEIELKSNKKAKHDKNNRLKITHKNTYIC